MKTGEVEEQNQYLLEVAIFMTSSARDIIKWKHYGPRRLLRSLVMILDLPNHARHTEKDKFLEEIKKELEMNSSLARDEEALANFLDDLIIKMLREYRRRSNLQKS